MDGLYRVQERGKESELKKEEAEEREREEKTVSGERLRRSDGMAILL